jgi:transposase
MNTNSNHTTEFPSAKARFRRAERLQMEWREYCLNDCVPAEHPVRMIWKYVQSLDLSPLLQDIKAVEGHVGRDATDPAILMSLWLYATINGVGSARQLAKLCTESDPYKWICGGVGVNRDLLARFRTDNTEFLDTLLADTIATLMHQKVVTLKKVAQDGMRVRANAGSSSFRREPTLKKCQQEAAEQVRKLREELDDDSASSSKRETAAKASAAQEREARVNAALENLKELQQQKEKRKKGSGKEARCSTTDPEARNMRMGDGGTRPAFNVQFATDGDTRIIVKADVSNNGSDAGQMSPLHGDVCQAHGVAGAYLVDGGFPTIADVTQMEKRGTRVIGPIPRASELIKKGVDPHAAGPKDTPEMSAFRERMATDEAKLLLKERPSIAEFPNAVCRNHGLHQFPVRGLAKCYAVTMWHVIAHNFQRMLNLGVLPI